MWALELSPFALKLLEITLQTFVPLMRQNVRAHTECLARGESLFNEAAFDAGRALYDGKLRGHPFRSVVKTFQVRTWADLRARWRALSSEERKAVDYWIPDLEDAFRPLGR
jgi:hypothetical protein